MSTPETHDLLILGAGPGGYVAAIRAAQLGMRVACIDENEQLGGTCLRVGCIPSKALLESSEHFERARGGKLSQHGVNIGDVTLDLEAMLRRKDGVVDQLTRGIAGLFKKNRITHLRGRGRLAGKDTIIVRDADGGETTVRGARILLATGSVPATIPGVVLDGDRVGTSTEALSYPEVPEHLVVIGAGVIGLELGSVWRRLGSRVTLLEYADTLLPAVDPELSRLAGRLFKKQGLDIRLGCKVQGAEPGAEPDGGSVTVRYERGEEIEEIVADRVLVATGRRPNTQGLDLEAAGLAADARGFIPVDEHYRTAVPGIWAIGDVIGGPMLAHKAEEEGVAAVERMAGLPGHVNYDAIPSVIYTHPEIASVGRTEPELVAAKIPFKKGTFPFMANGRAKALGDTDGMVKILAHAETDRLLGVHIIGPQASELIAEAAVAIEFSASAEDLAISVHAHPTLAETIKEAALATEGRVIHM